MVKISVILMAKISEIDLLCFNLPIDKTLPLCFVTAKTDAAGTLSTNSPLVGQPRQPPQTIVNLNLLPLPSFTTTSPSSVYDNILLYRLRGLARGVMCVYSVHIS